ncbi:MAG: carboxymuconolactone decarboxylase family protein [Actinobacteria bacterium]|nr:carboxymuconolactone decarboxylase family protein [Actinomycetota bacterium]
MILSPPSVVLYRVTVPRRRLSVTTVDETVQVRIDFDSQAPGFSRAMSHLDQAATKELDKVDFDVRLRELIRIRASQLNGCAYCVDMHTKDASAAGEAGQRIYALPVWRETPFYTARERAALALTESITLMPQTRVPAADFAAAAEQFTEAELGALISLIVTINAWNAIGVSTRTWLPGSYQP